MGMEQILSMPEGLLETTSLVAYLQESLKKDNTIEVFEGSVNRVFDDRFDGDVIDLYVVISPDYGIRDDDTSKQVGFRYDLEIKKRHKPLHKVNLYSAPIEGKNLLKVINLAFDERKLLSDKEKSFHDQGKHFVLPGISVYAAMAKLHGYDIGETEVKINNIPFDVNERDAANSNLNVEKLHREFMETPVVFRSHANGYGSYFIANARALKELSMPHEARQPFQ